MDTVIQIRDVVKHYGSGASEVRALEGVDLDVRAGEVLALMGPSGSGKTTLLSIMGCILRATAGSVKIAGREMVGLPESEMPRVRLQHFGFIFQGFNLFPALTARENVEIALDLKRAPRRQARGRAEELLAGVGLAEKAGSHPADLSGGEKQRVAIARALAGDPPMILADEPTAALDSASGKTVMTILSSLAHQRARAVVIVTHDPRVLGYADRVVRMADGRMLAEAEQVGELVH
jgi:putative ABC transport system ATP-binding protein